MKLSTALNHTEVKMRKLPQCALCEKKAGYDAVSHDGRWGYFCQSHWEECTDQRLGLGLGQRLVSDVEKAE